MTIDPSSDPVIIKTHATPAARPDIRDVKGPALDLLLLAFQELMNRDPQDPTSWFQIAGIHGMPYTLYDGVSWKLPDGRDFNTQDFGGYCMHNSQLFPTWHRPYLLLLEQELGKAAVKIAHEQFSNNPVYSEAAQVLRLPYWNWLDKAAQVPAIFTEPSVKLGSGQTIDNPLYQYKFQSDVMRLDDSSEEATPTPPTGSVSALQGDFTLRYPTKKARGATSDISNFTNTVATEVEKSIIPKWYQVLMDSYQGGTPDEAWFRFATTAKRNPSSLEQVHNRVHVMIGGGFTPNQSPGHMSLNEVAAFDPIFYLHHCNVDRLIDVWQKLFPDVYVTEQPTLEDTVNTDTGADGWKLETSVSFPLYPFRKHVDTGSTEEAGDLSDTFWTSGNVQRVEDLNYYYSTPAGPRPANLIPSAGRMPFNSNTSHGIIPDAVIPANFFRPRVYLELDGIVRWQFDGQPFSIRVYVFATATEAAAARSLEEEDLTDHYAGSSAVLVSAKTTPCANCHREENAKISDEVDLTDTLMKLNVLDDFIVKVKENEDLMDRVYLVAIDAMGGKHYKEDIAADMSVVVRDYSQHFNH